jgi:hypothetical protein
MRTLQHFRIVPPVAAGGATLLTPVSKASRNSQIGPLRNH